MDADMNDRIEELRAVARQLSTATANSDLDAEGTAESLRRLTTTVCATLELVLQMLERLVQTTERVDELSDTVWPGRN
jgi:hypothetical protein